MKPLFSIPVFCFLIFSCCFSLLYGQAPSGIWNWAKLEGSMDQEYAWDIIVDDFGYLYVTGYFEGSFQWDNITLTSNGSIDMFLAKLDPAGNLQWAVKAGGSGVDRAYAVRLHSNGHLYMAGYFSGNAQFGTQTFSSSGGTDAIVAVYDTAGNFVQAISGGGGGNDAFFTIEEAPDSNLIMGGYFAEGNTGASFDTLTINDHPGSFVSFPIVTKFTPQGSIIWANYGVSPNSASLRGLTIDSSGTLYVTGGFSNKLIWDTDSIVTQWTNGTYLTKLQADGQAEWVQGGGGPFGGLGYDVVINPQGQPTVLSSLEGGYGIFDGTTIGTQGLSFPPELLLLAYDTTGNLVEHLLFGSEHSYPSKMEYDAQGNLFICGSFGWQFFLDNQFVLPALNTSDGFMIKITPDDSVIMANGTFGQLTNEIFSFALGKAGNIYIAGYAETTTVFGDSLSSNFIKINNNGDYDIMLANITDTTFIPPGNNLVKGRLFFDANQNCIYDPGELPMASQLLRADPGPYWTMSDSLGNYRMIVDTGSFQLTQQLNPFQEQYITPICPSNPAFHSFSFTQSNDSLTALDFANLADSCFLIEVDVASTSRRLCFKNLTTISYRNVGSIAAPNAFVHLKLPSHVLLVQSDSSYQQLPDSTYVFPLGNVAAGFQGQISLIDSVACGDPTALLGLGQCTEVWATPVGTCIQPDSSWSGADLTVSASCQYGIGIFHIINQGTGAMTDSVDYRIYKDSLLIFQGKVKLPAGDSLNFQVPAQGSFLRVEVDQVAFHPGSTQASVDLQGCFIPYGPSDPSSPPPTALSLLYNPNDREPERTIDCMIITGAYDPNDKLATPIGFTPAHIIPTQTPIHYRIRFQNTGNDTAFKVVLIDTLSSLLDPTTLLMGASSHPHRFTLSGQGNPVLTFTFDNILLPDSTTDLLGSQGFASFTIQPYDSLPQGSTVQNLADIYFDFNPPIRTNTVVHTLLDTSFIQLDPRQVQLCVGSPSQAAAGVDSSFCELDSLTLYAATPSEGVGIWQIINGTGLLGDISFPQSPIHSLDYGSTELAWLVQLCEQVSRDTLSLHRFNEPNQASITALGMDSLTTGLSGGIYRWWLNGEQIDDTTASIEPGESGTYQVQIVNGPCVSDLSEPFDYILSSLEIGKDLPFSIYPNPNQGTINIHLSSRQSKPQVWTIYNSLGAVCAEKRILPFEGEQIIRWNVSHLAPGAYFVRAASLGGQKIWIMKP